MTFTEKELISLRAEILNFKKKLDFEKNKRKEDENHLIMQSENSSIYNNNFRRMKLSSSNSSYKLKNIELYNEYYKQYQSQLVYINTDLEDHLDEDIKNQIDEEFASDDDENDNYEEENRINNDILSNFQIDKLLKPITKPSDIINTKSINNIYKQNFFDKLSNQTVAVIEKEQEMVNLLNKTMDIFLNDDPERILADNLKLAEYDHHLDLDKTSNSAQNNITTQQQYDQFNKNNSEDPFFKLPDYDSNPEFGNIPQEEIDETRQLLQIALQRNEEYIRSLSQIRLGFLHADNYKNNIYKWCKEIHENELNQHKGELDQ